MLHSGGLYGRDQGEREGSKGEGNLPSPSPTKRRFIIKKGGHYRCINWSFWWNFLNNYSWGNIFKYLHYQFIMTFWPLSETYEIKWTNKGMRFHTKNQCWKKNWNKSLQGRKWTLCVYYLLYLCCYGPFGFSFHWLSYLTSSIVVK